MYVFGLGGLGGVGGEWVTGVGFTNSGGTWGKWYMCFGCGGVGGVEGEWVVLRESGWAAWTRVWEGVVVLCLSVL